MGIEGQITGIKYTILLADDLKQIGINKFNINDSPACFILKDRKNSYALSKWVSPKRTRSYPYERVYNTLNSPKKITIIPIIKDEGVDGDRDYLQWDTISLMSLLDVFVIFAYYEKATKNPKYSNKITDFKFNNKYILSKIKEIKQYHSSALHWNLNELNTNLFNIVEKVQKSYAKIGTQTGVILHNQLGIDKFLQKIGNDVSLFMDFSREKAEKAQAREILTVQPKERLFTTTKEKITITNYLGGQYFFTVDEVSFDNNILLLVESKHTKHSLLPSKGDIKDGLLKMILYSNLTNVIINGIRTQSKGVLNLTSSLLQGQLISNHKTHERVKFFLQNNLSPEISLFIDTLFKEADINNFILKIGMDE